MRKLISMALIAGAVSLAHAQSAGSRSDPPNPALSQGAEPTAPAIGKMGPGMAGGSGPKYPRQTDCRSNQEACAAAEKARKACRKLNGPERRQCFREHRKAP